MARARRLRAALASAGVFVALLESACTSERQLTLVPALPTPCSPSAAELRVAGLGDFAPLADTIASGTSIDLTLALPRGTRVVTLQGVGGSGAIGRTAPLDLATSWSDGRALPVSFGPPEAVCTTAALVAPRLEHHATLLLDGSVLLTGGIDALGASAQPVTVIERYLPVGSADDPQAHFVALAGTLEPREALGHTATLLVDGRVLLAGGVPALAGVAQGVAYEGAQLLDATGRPQADARVLSGGPRALHAAVALDDGRVLLTGGCVELAGGRCTTGQALASAVLYDPIHDAFSTAPSLLGARWGHEALLRPDGLVLLVGGYGDDGSALEPELYDPDESRGSSLLGPAGSSVQLDSGLVIGFNDAAGPSDEALAWSGDTDPPRTLPQLPSARTQGTVTALEDGTVLFAGGWDGASLVPSSVVLGADGLSATRIDGFLGRAHTATRLLDGTVLLAGGVDEAGVVAGPARVFVHSLVGPYDSPATLAFASSSGLVPNRPGRVSVAAGTLVVDGSDDTTLALLAGPTWAGPSASGFQLDVLAGRASGGTMLLVFGSPGASLDVIVVVTAGQVPAVEQSTVGRPGLVAVATQKGCTGSAVTEDELPQDGLAAWTLRSRDGRVELRSATRVVLSCDRAGWPMRGAIALGARGGSVRYDNLTLTR